MPAKAGIHPTVLRDRATRGLLDRPVKPGDDKPNVVPCEPQAEAMETMSKIGGEPGRAPSVELVGEKRAKRRFTMKKTLRNGAVALALVGGAALMSAPASANSVHNEGYFGGSWTSIGPGNYYQRRHAGRVGPLYSHRVYRDYGPGPYAYYGGPAYYSPYYYSYGYGPPLVGGPGIGFSIGID
jgi:hypothetical protein